MVSPRLAASATDFQWHSVMAVGLAFAFERGMSRFKIDCFGQVQVLAFNKSGHGKTVCCYAVQVTGGSEASKLEVVAG